MALHSPFLGAREEEKEEEEAPLVRLSAAFSPSPDSETPSTSAKPGRRGKKSASASFFPPGFQWAHFPFVPLSRLSTFLPSLPFNDQKWENFRLSSSLRPTDGRCRRRRRRKRRTKKRWQSKLDWSFLRGLPPSFSRPVISLFLSFRPPPSFLLNSRIS